MSILDLYNKYFKVAFWLIIIFEILSFLGHNIEIVNQVLFWLIILGTLIISLWKLEYGFWIVCVELFIGSFGYLFFYDLGDFRISIRLGIFLAVFISWFILAIKKKQFIFKRSKLWKSWLILFIFILLGIFLGLQNGNDAKNIFFDFNAYLYFGLIFVAFHVINSWTRINHLLQVLLASTIAMAIKTIFLLFYFSHQLDENLFRLVYIWIRDTRVGEIAPVAQNYYRIFFQSHIWSLFVFIIFFIILVLIIRNRGQLKNYKMIWIITLLSSLTLIISFSRSFWLALAMVLVLIFIYLFFKERIGWKKIGKIISIMIVILILELGFITGLVNIKLPSFGGGGGVPIASLIKERATSTEEAALVSRFELLKPLVNKFLEKPFLGSGFGTTVSFQSEDPRTKDINGGWYTTYAFEWGYLDILVKIGLFGLLAYLFFVYKIFKDGLFVLKKSYNREEYILVLGLLFSLIALLIIHFTTPYLNHPLGILLIIILSSIFFTLKNQLQTKSIKPAEDEIHR